MNGLIHDREQERDANRDHWFNQNSFTVLRFKNQQIAQDIETVLTTIAQHISSLKYLPPQQLNLLCDHAPLSLGRGAGGEGLTPSPTSGRGR